MVFLGEEGEDTGGLKRVSGISIQRFIVKLFIIYSLKLEHCVSAVGNVDGHVNCPRWL